MKALRHVRVGLTLDVGMMKPYAMPNCAGRMSAHAPLSDSVGQTVWNVEDMNSDVPAVANSPGGMEPATMVTAMDAAKRTRTPAMQAKEIVSLGSCGGAMVSGLCR